MQRCLYHGTIMHSIKIFSNIVATALELLENFEEMFHKKYVKNTFLDANHNELFFLSL